MDKLNELKKLNNRIQTHIRNLSNQTYSSSREIVNEEYNYNPKLEYSSDNESTSTNIFKLEKGMKSDVMSDAFFNRIICTKGKIVIRYALYSEEVIVVAPNTLLLVPETKYHIEALEDSEYISVYMPIKSHSRFQIKERETIYNKL